MMRCLDEQRKEELESVKKQLEESNANVGAMKETIEKLNSELTEVRSQLQEYQVALFTITISGNLAHSLSLRNVLQSRKL